MSAQGGGGLPEADACGRGWGRGVTVNEDVSKIIRNKKSNRIYWKNVQLLMII